MIGTSRRRRALAVVIGGVWLVASACGATSTPADVATCPAQHPVGYLATDVSDTARSTVIMKERHLVIAAFLTSIATCNGHAKVVAFTSSAAATRTLFDQDLVPAGATAISHRRRVPRLVETAMKKVDAELRNALAELPGDGTDVLAQLQLASEYRLQVGDGRPLVAEILTDGLSTVGLDLNQASLTPAVATGLADARAVPALPGARITFGGIGKMAGPLPPTSFVDSLKAFYGEACRRTQADCQVVTDLAAGVSR